MGGWIKKRQIPNVLCFALVACAPLPTSEPFDAYRLRAVASLLEGGGYGGSEKYLEPRHDFGEENDVKAKRVICKDDRLLLESVINAFIEHAYSRDYDRYGVRNCATLKRSLSLQDNLVTTTVRICVHSELSLALCDVTFVAMGSQWVTNNGTDVEVEEDRDELMHETIATLEGIATQLSAREP